MDILSDGILISNRYVNQNQEKLLQAALLTGEKGTKAWHYWKQNVNFENEIDHGSFRLLPLLYLNLKNRHIDHPLMTRLKGIYKQAWFRNQKIINESRGMLSFFNTAGIPTMVLKGAALTVQIYKNFAIRPMADIDILVPFERAEEAIKLLISSGWRANSHHSITDDLRFRHSLQFLDGSGNEFDLHWHPLLDCSIKAADSFLDRQFWENSVQVEIAGVPTMAPSKADSLFLVIIHGTWRNAEPPIRWIADAVKILNSRDGHLDWQLFLQSVKNYSAALRVTEALNYLIDKFDVSIPDYVMIEISKMDISPAQRLVYHNSLKKPGEERKTVTDRIPGLIKYLRTAGDDRLLRLASGYHKYLKYVYSKRSVLEVYGYFIRVLLNKVRSCFLLNTIEPGENRR